LNGLVENPGQRVRETAREMSLPVRGKLNYPQNPQPVRGKIPRADQRFPQDPQNSQIVRLNFPQNPHAL
jgi:hypothetical protein